MFHIKVVATSIEKRIEGTSENSVTIEKKRTNSAQVGHRHNLLQFTVLYIVAIGLLITSIRNKKEGGSIRGWVSSHPVHIHRQFTHLYPCSHVDNRRLNPTHCFLTWLVALTRIFTVRLNRQLSCTHGVNYWRLMRILYT